MDNVKIILAINVAKKSSVQFIKDIVSLVKSVNFNNSYKIDLLIVVIFAPD